MRFWEFKHEAGAIAGPQQVSTGGRNSRTSITVVIIIIIIIIFYCSLEAEPAQEPECPGSLPQPFPLFLVKYLSRGDDTKARE